MADRGFDKNQISGGKAERAAQVRKEARGVFGGDQADEEEHGEDLGDRKSPDLEMGGMEFKPATTGGMIVTHSYKGNNKEGHPDQHGRSEQHVAHDRATAHAHLDHLFDSCGTDEGGRTGTSQSQQHGTTSGSSGPGWSDTPGEY